MGNHIHYLSICKSDKENTQLIQEASSYIERRIRLLGNDKEAATEDTKKILTQIDHNFKILGEIFARRKF